MRISCFTIGDNSLLIACTELLLEQGHQVLGVVTRTPQVADWASAKGLAVIDAGQDYSVPLSRSRFDYLFSIAYLAIVPGQVLKMARRAAINFHDGLLPDYAGLNVPVWALLRGEARHGVTWHVMTDQADAGDIVKQTEFAICDDDTALTLNAKCFDAGIRTFSELIDDLADGSMQRRPQDLTRRQYFAREARPPTACFLDWRQPAAELDRLVRATHFGNYPNPLGAAKIRHAGRVWVVQSSCVVADGSSEPPGTMVCLGDDQLQVATGRGLLALKALAELDGQTANLAELARQAGLRRGDCLDVLSDADCRRLTEQNRRAAKFEEFWARHLIQFQPVEAVARCADGNLHQQTDTVTLEVPPVFRQRFADAPGEATAAAFAAFLAVTAQVDRVDLAFEQTTGEPLLSDDRAWFSRRIPLPVPVDRRQSFGRALSNWHEQRQRFEGRDGWLRDLVGRTPELRGKSALRGGYLDATGVHIVDAPDFRPGRGDGSAPVLVVSPAADKCALSYGRDCFALEPVQQLVTRFRTFLDRVAADPDTPLDEISTLTAADEQRLLVDWNQTFTPYPRTACVHQLFEQQVRRTPAAEALVFAGQSMTYEELNGRANQLASHLRALGVGPDQLVGVCVERSLEMVVAILAVQKAGGAYLPLDPTFPPSRIALMLQDSRASTVITQAHLVAHLPATSASLVRIDGDWDSIAAQPTDDLAVGVRPDNLAYVMYTSGSTGRPKGVLVEHRNVVNFFTGMDQCIDVDPAGRNVLLAVTSLSFDISVLELCWTLARGFKVVIYAERHRPSVELTAGKGTSPMRFGLFYFASDEGERAEDKYRLLIEGAKFADQHGFVSVSTPERHFHAFGGLYPNPSVAAAALATITQRVQLRAGSVVLPLHHPIRVAEEWALVDNLSHGRVGISFASGWQPVDFVIRPENYRDRYTKLYEQIEVVRKLWRGEQVEFQDADGALRAIRTLPRPVQQELPVWVTTAGHSQTWISAGRIGANVLTHLLGQSIDEVAGKIRLYRQAYRAAGHAGDGSVTLMLHTFVGDDLETVRETVRKPMTDYLASAVSLVRDVASSWAAFKRKADGTTADVPHDLSRLSADDLQDLLAFSFERYFSSSGLFGTPEQCATLVRHLRGIGVDEIACLIDFGIDTDTVLDHLGHLNQLRILCENEVAMTVPEPAPASGRETIAALIRDHGVTHLQCTPSLATMIVADDEGRAALGRLQTIMVGGEAFPVALARELRAATSATLINMYGPTETTIWSATQRVSGEESSIPIGRPVANTQLYILDDQRRPVPVGTVGELYIGGEGVARGYHDRPQLTAERFVRNPFWPADATDATDEKGPSKRIYRTGDLARYRADGAVEFLGRVDHQVKLRGYRIELGEIETAMTDHPGVRKAVVLARDDQPGDRRLVGYYLSDPRQPVDEASLRSMLRDRLPAYMVPSHFVVLSDFPQTPNGKIDRRALPAPERLAPAGGRPTPRGPASEVEAKIAAIWQDVLGIVSAGRDDNFFDIGGHSLLAVKALRLLRDTFEKELAITDLFRFPTVSSLATYLASAPGGPSLERSRERGAARRELLARRRPPHSE